MKKLIIFFIIVIVLHILSYSQVQTYYGKKSFGQIQIINDTICTISFFYNYGYAIDTCFIRKSKDTIFISSKESWRCEINIYDENQIETPIKDIIIVKQYNYSFSNRKYEYVGEYPGIYDTIKKMYILRRGSFSRGNYLLVYKDISSYSRIKCTIDSCYNNYVGLKLNPQCLGNRMMIFNEFPLLVKGNKLVPIDKEKQAQCWLDNGFLFPKMTISDKCKKYNVINANYIGLRNLSTELSPELSKFLPKKYMKYLN